jgi:V/A-type H+-transporting ATPase subunit F
VKKILVVTPAPSVAGFAMAGVMAREAVPLELPRLIDDAVADTSVGVLAIDERVIGRQVQERIREIERRWHGAVVILPSPSKPAGPEEDYAQRLIRRAIGYQVRVQL